MATTTAISGPGQRGAYFASAICSATTAAASVAVDQCTSSMCEMNEPVCQANS